MLSYYVYILECCDKSYYTGITNNLEKRLGEHNSGYAESAYTFSRRPVVLKFSQEFFDVKAAIAFEKQLKGWSRKKKEALMGEEWERLKELSASSSRQNVSKNDKC